MARIKLAMKGWLQRLLLVCLVGSGWWGGASLAHARDVRLALLVANQQGWKNDPKLRYVVHGDVRPLAATLRRIGFQVKVLENKSADEVRRAFQWVQQRSQQAPRLTTFLFYYSGHADRKHFHLGPRGKRPLTYNTFIQFIKALPVERRIALIDACFSGEIIRQFGSMRAYKQLVGKGVNRIRQIDISHNFPNQSQAKGLQIVTSSLDMSWESQKHKASVFTHYLLQGIEGPADQDRDGKISVNELFDYISISMKREIKQQPMMFGIVRRTGAYALAPAYKSRLRIGSQVVGRLRISVDTFYWSQHKRKRQALSLAIVPGEGVVELQRKGRCWKQHLLFRKGQETHLADQWKSISCKRSAHYRKGMLELPVQLMPMPSAWQIELHGGILVSPIAGNALLSGGHLGLRHEYWGIQLGMWGTSVAFQQSAATQLILHAQFHGGYRKQWQSFDLFAGGYVGLHLLVQDVGVRDLLGTFFRYGLALTPSLWLSPRWALSLHMEAGFHVGLLGGELQHLFSFQAALGVRYRI